MSFLHSFIRRISLQGRIRIFLFPLIAGWIFTTWILIIQNYMTWRDSQIPPIDESAIVHSLQSEVNTIFTSEKGLSKQELVVKASIFDKKIEEVEQVITKQIKSIKEHKQEAGTMSKWIIIFCFVVFVSCGTILSGLAWYIVRDLTSQVTLVSSEINQSSSLTTTSSRELADASNALSAGVTQQAAALQETVASLEEVRAMVTKNADNANKAQTLAVESTKTSHKGKEAVTEMMNAMGDIHQGNEAIQNQVEASNNELAEITKVIFEIANKTKIINDIVFQTKLLSFNASVEAARAGEHGKGFAVVAEEIGNLAQMSGGASKDIAQLVEGSIKKVDKIIKDTKSKVNSLVQVGKEKVESGNMTARHCNDVLDSILKNVEDMTQMIGEMSTASSEQARGVDEISKAMNQVEIVTQGNSSAANQATIIAQHLNDQAIKLGHHVVMLQTISEGEKKTSKTLKTSSDEPSKQHDSQEHVPLGNILPLASNRKAEAKNDAQTYKKAIGAENPPSENDPRFEDV
ncbi:MAG: hypothetical protein HYV97_09730 [Bdellovibrio sp.]|nr:hypothetical protein [Bdellovibrio sp.]